VGSITDSEEVVQEAFVQFFSNYDDQANIQAFTLLYKICKDCIKKFWRDPARREKILDFNSRMMQNVIKDTSVNIEEEFIKNEEALSEIVNEELEHLPALYRDILKKYYYEDMTHEEIAEDCSRQWITFAIDHGRRLLKVRLKKRGVK
jgi:RNA polymerase sigma-70 factor (ECF subfamily)